MVNCLYNNIEIKIKKKNSSGLSAILERDTKLFAKPIKQEVSI